MVYRVVACIGTTGNIVLFDHHKLCLNYQVSVCKGYCVNYKLKIFKD